MNRFVFGVAATLGTAAIAMCIVIVSGIVSVAADEPHSALTYQILAFARERSIKSHANDIEVPKTFADPDRVRRGAGNFEAMCANCHLSPEAGDSEIRKGLYPTPPNLSDKPQSPSPRDAIRDFWIIKHGIKASGMPAWSKGGMEDEDIWDLAAFLQKIPSLSASTYRQLVAESDGHSHGGLGNSRHETAHTPHHH